MNTIKLDGSLFAKMVKNGAANLNRSRDAVNDLNVFPIPDGDTGDNMYMTIDSGSHAVKEDEELTLEETSSKIARGMLLGARGNSGVILSRIFAGIARGFVGNGSAGVDAVAKAFECGISESYSAVSVPVEGTILTVYRDAVEFANSRIHENSTLEEYFEDLMCELRLSLDRTPELLETLRDAGVVDSGGAGIVYIVEGMKMALDGVFHENVGGAIQTAHTVDTSLFDENSVMQYGYCTEFLLRLQNAKVNVADFDETPIIEWLNKNGESVAAFRDGSILKVHVHTMTPGAILAYCQQFGEFLTMKIENMMLQHEGTVKKAGFEAPKKSRHKAVGIVTVASGEGIQEVFRSLGTDVVIDGGQSMNPSAESFIDAFEQIDADTILVFPNNSNIILTAKQAAALYGKADVRVIENRTIGEGYAALSMLDTSVGDVDAMLAEIGEAIGQVVTGTVSVASRDTEMDGIAIKSGDYIGFVGDTVYVDMPTAEDCLIGLADKLSAGRHDILILICGKETDAERAEAVYAELQNNYKRTEVIMIDGGQPIYDYLMILE